MIINVKVKFCKEKTNVFKNEIIVNIPSDSILPVNPTEKDRILTGLCQKPTFSVKQPIGSYLLFIGLLSMGIRIGLLRRRYGQTLP